MPGCASVRKKFVRKKKGESKEVVVYRPLNDATKPPFSNETMYEQHMAYWRTWVLEWIDHLTHDKQNQKKLRDVAWRAVEELKAMQRYLAEEHQPQLEPFIRELETFRSLVLTGSLSQADARGMQSKLQRHHLAVERRFRLEDVQVWLRPEASESPPSPRPPVTP